MIVKRILPIDELNILKAKYEIQGTETPITDFDLEDIIDELLDLFLDSMADAVKSINEQFEADYKPSAAEIEKVIYRKIDGASWEDRVRTWYENGGTAAEIVRIAETESHRIGNETAFEAAKKVGATTKTWVCMMLPTSRDTHIYLNNTKVGIDDYFYSYRGGKTLFPGQFGEPEEDVNCLCELEFS